MDAAVRPTLIRTAEPIYACGHEAPGDSACGSCLPDPLRFRAWLDPAWFDPRRVGDESTPRVGLRVLPAHMQAREVAGEDAGPAH